MPSVNQSNPQLGNTVRLFDEFYEFGIDVPVDEYDTVNSFFLSVFQDRQAADNFTVTLFRISEQSKTPVLDLLTEIQGQGQIELTATLAYYLNGLRSGSTLLGINAAVTPNFYTARNVLA